MMCQWSVISVSKCHSVSRIGCSGSLISAEYESDKIKCTNMYHCIIQRSNNPEKVREEIFTLCPLFLNSARPAWQQISIYTWSHLGCSELSSTDNLSALPARPEMQLSLSQFGASRQARSHVMSTPWYDKDNTQHRRRRRGGRHN